MKRKFLANASLLMASVMLLVGCGNDVAETAGSQSTAQSTTQSAVESSTATEDVEKELVTLTLWVPEIAGLDYDTCLETRVIEEKFNVDLQFDVYSSAADSSTLFNLMIASDEYPDIITGKYTTDKVAAAAEAGALLSLNDYIVDGTAYKAALDANDGWEAMMTSYDGNIYNFPYTDVGVHKASEYKMWYSTEMLENLGWDAPPSTPEEFKQYLIDIRDKDANGNGDTTDEIPLMGYNAGRKTDPICFLMNPFELYTENFFYITDDNEIYFSAVTDDWREGLKYIADLYAEGLIAEETYVQDQSTFRGYLNKEEPVVGVTPNWYIGGEFDSAVLSTFDYLALEPLAGEYQQTAARIGGQVQLGGMISSTCENPDRAFEVLDYLISEEGVMLGMWGVEGETFEYVDGENFMGTTPAISVTVDKLNEHIWNGSTHPRVDSEEIRYGSLDDESKYEVDNTYSLVSAAKVYEPYYVNHHIPDIIWCDDDDVLETRSELKTQINEYIRSSTTQFIMGRLDVNDDAVWQNYLNELDKMGLDEYIDVLYDYYGLR